MTWWNEAAEKRAQQPPQPLPAPQIPQQPVAAPSRAQRRAEAEASIKGPAPAATAEERFGVQLGQDIIVTPSRPSTATSYVDDEESRRLARQVDNEEIRLNIAAGEYGNETAAAAHANAAYVSARKQNGDPWAARTDTTQRRVDAAAIAATQGHTRGHG